jgi:hypothetical protein
MNDSNNLQPENVNMDLLVSLLLLCQNQDNTQMTNLLEHIDPVLLNSKRKKISDDNIIVPTARINDNTLIDTSLNVSNIQQDINLLVTQLQTYFPHIFENSTREDPNLKLTDDYSQEIKELKNMTNRDNNAKKGNPINKILNIINHQPKKDELTKDYIIGLLKENNNPSNNINNSDTIKDNKKYVFVSKKQNDSSLAGQYKRNCCSCNKSHCLKLYCDCFKKSEYCTSCSCDSCFNNKEYEFLRQASVSHLKHKSKNAFKKKVILDSDNNIIKHIKGCNCKNSSCMKGYCECHQHGVKCSPSCKCKNCYNK